MSDRFTRQELNSLLKEQGVRSDSALIRVEKQGFYVYYEGWLAYDEQALGLKPSLPKDEMYRRNVFYVNTRRVDDPVLLRSYMDGMKSVGEIPESYLSVLSLDIKTYRLDEFERDGVPAVRFYDPVNVGAFCKDAVIEAMRYRATR